MNAENRLHSIGRCLERGRVDARHWPDCFASVLFFGVPMKRRSNRETILHRCTKSTLFTCERTGAVCFCSTSILYFALSSWDGLDDNITASVTFEIPFGAVGNSPDCDDATPPGSTKVSTTIFVPAADLGAVLDLLPTASSSINLAGVFGEVSLGNTLFIF